MCVNTYLKWVKKKKKDIGTYIYKYKLKTSTTLKVQGGS